jgi:hypothetical protein
LTINRSRHLNPALLHQGFDLLEEGLIIAIATRFDEAHDQDWAK